MKKPIPTAWLTATVGGRAASAAFVLAMVIGKCLGEDGVMQGELPNWREME